jgi:hypothetical protein
VSPGVKQESSFSVEKEAKRLSSAWAELQTDRKFFGSFF